MAVTRMLMLVCLAACLTSAHSARQRPIFKAVPTPVYREMLAPSSALQDEMVAFAAEPSRQAVGVVQPTRTVIVTQPVLRSVTVIKTSVITIVETTIINAMTSTTIFHTVPITIYPAAITRTITVPCNQGLPKGEFPELAAEKEPLIVETPIENAAPVVAEDPIKDPTPVLAETPFEVAPSVAAEASPKDPAPALDDPASEEQVSKLQSNVDELMNTFNDLLSQIELTVQRQTLVNRMRAAAKKVTMLRSSAVQVEFVRNFKVLVSQAAMLKANPKIFFNSVEELVDKMDNYYS